MDSSQTFTQAILNQLRRDLKRFAFGRAAELDGVLGRSNQYFRRVSAEHAKLVDAAVAARFSGFKLIERIKLLDGVSEGVPTGASGFLRRHRLKPSDRACLKHFRGFLSWVYGVGVSPSTAERSVDLTERLATLGGSDLSADVILNYADALFLCLIHDQPALLAPGSARGLIRTMLRVVEVLPSERSAFRVAANLLDAGFYLEGQLDALGLRELLYSASARVSAGLGFPYDGIWCARQAMFLAALQGDSERLDQHRRLASQLFESRSLQVPFRSWLDGNPVFGARQDLREHGLREQKALLAALESDRARAPLEAKDLDKILGRVRAYASASGGRSSMSMGRLNRLIHTLGAEWPIVLNRAAVLDPMPPDRAGNLFQGLKLARPHKPLYRFQTVLIRWAQGVAIDDTATRIVLEEKKYTQAEREPFHGLVIEDLRRLADQAPNRLHSRDAELIAEGLARICYTLQYQSRLDDAVDMLTVALYLQERSRDPRKLAFGYRSGAYLAVDLGQLGIAILLLQRAREIDLWAGELHGLTLSLYAEGTFAWVQGHPAKAKGLYQSCLLLVERGHGRLQPWWVHSALAANFLRLGDGDQALSSIEMAERLFSDDSPAATAEFLATKAEVFSHAGLNTKSLLLFNDAQAHLDSATNPRDLALIGLSKCDHLLRHQQFDQARREAEDLLRLSSLLKRNPIGSRALQEVCARALTGSLDGAFVIETRERVLYPNLFGRAAASR